jgi:hypothetical protein
MLRAIFRTFMEVKMKNRAIAYYKLMILVAAIVTVAGCNLYFSIIAPDKTAQIQITPRNPSINTGEQIQFHVYQIGKDGSRNELTENVIWQSSNALKVTVSATGLAVSFANEDVRVAISAQASSSYDYVMLTVGNPDSTPMPAGPTVEPTSVPTGAPTSVPTSVPTAAPTAVPTLRPNLIVNPGFESDADGWDLSKAEIVTDDKYSGTNSAYLGTGGATISQTITGLDIAATYQLEVHLKGINDATNTMGIIHLKIQNCVGGDIAITYTGIGSWESVKASFKSLDGSITIVFQHIQSYTYIDDVSLE